MARSISTQQVVSSMATDFLTVHLRHRFRKIENSQIFRRFQARDELAHAHVSLGPTSPKTMVDFELLALNDGAWVLTWQDESCDYLEGRVLEPAKAAEWLLAYKHELPADLAELVNLSATQKSRLRMTLGDLLAEVESSERAYNANMATVARMEQEGRGIEAYGMRIQAAALLFQPDSETMPGIDRLEIICNARWGTGLTCESVRRLRGELCTAYGYSMKQANKLDLNAAADGFENAPPCPGCGNQPAARDVDDVCPACGAFRFRCRIARHIPLGDGEPIIQRLGKPFWERIPPSQIVRKSEIKPESDDNGFACPGCRAALPETYRVLPKVLCQSCGQYECNTGNYQVAVAGGPAEVINVASPSWLPIPPIRRDAAVPVSKGEPSRVIVVTDHKLDRFEVNLAECKSFGLAGPNDARVEIFRTTNQFWLRHEPQSGTGHFLAECEVMELFRQAARPMPMELSPTTTTTTTPQPQPSNAHAVGADRNEIVPNVAEFVFVRHGDMYFIRAFGVDGHFGLLKGFEYIAKLISQPGKAVLMVELIGGSLEDQIVGDSHSIQPVLDSTAKHEACEQLTELNNDLDRARRNNDEAEITRLEQEKERLESSLLAVVGLAGRDRDLNNPADKLRPRINNALKTSYEKLRSAQPTLQKLAEHFNASIRSTGLTYIYEPRSAILWSSEIPKIRQQ
jgi:hypothetical protein